MTDHLLEIRDLHTCFRADGNVVRAVDGIDLDVPRGSTTCTTSPSARKQVCRSRISNR